MPSTGVDAIEQNPFYRLFPFFSVTCKASYEHLVGTRN